MVFICPAISPCPGHHPPRKDVKTPPFGAVMSRKSDMAPPSARPTYTQSQLEAYFAHISLPQISRDLAFSGSKLHDNATNALKFLTELQQYQLAAVPFENLSLHYSQHYSISLDPEVLFKKIVGYEGNRASVEGKNYRGGYCMENNGFFGTVLRSLGFQVYSAGARVYKDGTYLPW